MRIYQFKQSVHIGGPNLHGKRIPGKDFARGLREVSPDYEQHPHFLKYAAAGLIVDGPKESKASLPDPEKQKQKLLDRIGAEADARKAKSQKPSEEKAEEALLEQAAEGKAEEPEGKGKKHKKDHK